MSGGRLGLGVGGGGGCVIQCGLIMANGHIVTRVCGQINTTENITFPQLRRWAVIMIKTTMHSSRMRTARSLPYGGSLSGGLPNRDPLAKTPRTETPMDRDL